MKLIIKFFGKPIKELSLEEGREYLIGRSEDCDIPLFEDKSLSRRQIKISCSENLCRLESLSDKADLYFEGEKIQSLEVSQNSSLNLKNYSLNFVFPEEEEPPLEKAPAPPEESPPPPLDEETQVIAPARLLYSLRISIEGEFSDYVNLNLGEKWTIGRSPECDICIDYDLLTRRHLEVLKKADSFYVRDLGSANKTYLNSSPIPPHKEILLGVNDEIYIEDLRILFEVRDTEYENRMKNLPVLKEESHSIMPVPKLILEESMDEEIEPKKSFLQKKALFIATALILVTGAAFYAHYESNKKKTAVVKKESDESIKKTQWDILYQNAQEKLQAGKYLECINDIQDLSAKVPNGYYEDSIKIMKECEYGLELNRQKKAEEEAEKERLKTEEKINAIVARCEKEYNEGKIQSLESLNECARELFDLDPSNSAISKIRTFLEDKEMQRKMAEEERMKQRQWIQSKKALYTKAKKLAEQDKALLAVSAYDRFLKAGRGIASLKSLYDKAEKERDSIQKNYDSQLESLLSLCFSLMDQKNYKEAYDSCKKVLDFKPYDSKALRSIQTAESSLKSEIKPLYEKSQWHESFSRIEEAKKLWEQILEKDIKGGYYYKKALVQIKKYE